MIVDPNAQTDRAVRAPTLSLVVDASVDHQTLTKGHIGKRDANRIGAGRMLPDATPRLKLEVLQHGSADPKPWALGIADEALGRRHRTAFETPTGGPGLHPGASLRAIRGDELDSRLVHVLDEVVENAIRGDEPHANAHAIEVFFEVGRLVARRCPANAELPHAIDTRGVSWSGHAQ